MRLVCPNCDAEYEVDASAIPDAGRDVQCSNCGHAWFQLSPRVAEDLAAEEALFEAPPQSDQPARGMQASAEIEAQGHDQDGDLGEDLDAPDPAPDLASAPAAAPARALDESVLAVLREEAAREAEARRAEAPALETQSELGLSAAMAQAIAEDPLHEADANQPDPVAQRLAKMKGIEPSPAKPQSRRDMLPEIDEINTTLRAANERRPGEAGAVSDSLPNATPKSAFRSGFVLAMLIGVVTVLLYIMAPSLAQQIPGLDGAMTSYVATIDSARLWLDGLLQQAIGAMRGDAAS